MFMKTAICVRYFLQDGWHVFASEDLVGLYVAHKDFKQAFDDVPMSIQKLIALDYDADVIATPERQLEESTTPSGAFVHWNLSYP